MITIDSLLDLVRPETYLKKVLSSVASSINVNYPVYIVHNDFIAIAALNADDSQGIKSLFPIVLRG